MLDKMHVLSLVHALNACNSFVLPICTPRFFLAFFLAAARQQPVESTFRWEDERGCLAVPSRNTGDRSFTSRSQLVAHIDTVSSIVHIFLMLAESNVETGLVSKVLSCDPIDVSHFK